MWLINVYTKQLSETSNRGAQQPYAILSHTWGADEVSFDEFSHLNDQTREKRGYAKIEGACRQAKEDSLDFVWCDTCCINKSSSAELSEAINSMYRWYHDAAVCYVYLDDVEGGHLEKFTQLHGDLGTSPLYMDYTYEACRVSRWFTRAWTLQELIAPRWVEFFDRSWKAIGPKSQLRDVLTRITLIDAPVLEDRETLQSYAFAKRMSWASGRQSTRLEDMAYSLLGIFDINMPMLYGEGEKAFIRLQYEIFKDSTDQSLLSWTPYLPEHVDLLLAPSPFCFRQSTAIQANIDWRRDSEFSVSNRGLRISLPVRDYDTYLLVALNCDDSSLVPPGSQSRGNPVVIKLRKLPVDSMEMNDDTTGVLCRIERTIEASDFARLWLGGVLAERKLLTILTTTAATVVTIEFVIGPGLRIHEAYPMSSWHSTDMQFRLASDPGTAGTWAYIVVEHIQTHEYSCLCLSQSFELRWSLPPLRMKWTGAFAADYHTMDNQTALAVVQQADQTAIAVTSLTERQSTRNVFARVFTSDYTRLIKIWKGP